MSALLVGHFGCFTDQQDLTGQPDALVGSGVEANRIYFRPGPHLQQPGAPELRGPLAAY